MQIPTSPYPVRLESQVLLDNRVRQGVVDNFNEILWELTG